MASEENQAMEEGDAVEEEEDYNDSEEDTELQKAKQALTGRGVTLSDLMDEGIIHSGENLLSIDYRGQRFEADLLPNGKIKWHGAEEEFCTPSAWATHCKRLVNPIKRSGCGWASVKYKGRKLDTWKSIWSRRHHPGSPFRSTSPHQAALAAETHNGSVQATATMPLNVQATALTPHNVQATALTPHNIQATALTPHNVQATALTSHNIQATALTPHNIQATALTPHNIQATALTPHNIQATALTPHSIQAIATTLHNLQATAVTPHNVQAPATMPHNIQATPHNIQATAVTPHKVQATATMPLNIQATPHNIQATPHNIQATAVTPHSVQAIATMPLNQENGELKGDPPSTTEAVDTRVQETIMMATAAVTTVTAAAMPTTVSVTTLTASSATSRVTTVASPPSSTAAAPLLSPVANGAGTISFRPSSEMIPHNFQEEALNLIMAPGSTDSTLTEESSKVPVRSAVSCGLPSQRISVKYASLGPRTDARDPGTFVKCEHFENMSRSQPFSVTVSTNALMLMDFHCHLTTSEVVGYLGGTWCPETHNVRISQAFPCKCLLSDKDKAAIVEEEIRQSMERQGCSVVGWYHSHPLCQPDPSLRDIDCQMHHQVSMKGPGGIYLPCVGLILSPYDCRNNKAESSYEAFWVMPPPEDNPNGYGMPMHVRCIVHQSSSLSEELLHEMNQLADFYRGFATRIRWKELWSDNLSHLEKMKRSLRSKLPKDQTESSSFFAFLQQLLTRK
ncbi:MPN domain-containing protein-like [Babylonia areolata]|uniref:MPN domain-containing protein-like n=1 Tax=Babylonia areolata TaxID=304850 RepID=UPI003FD3212F